MLKIFLGELLHNTLRVGNDKKVLHEIKVKQRSFSRLSRIPVFIFCDILVSPANPDLRLTIVKSLIFTSMHIHAVSKEVSWYIFFLKNFSQIRRNRFILVASSGIVYKFLNYDVA